MRAALRQQRRAAAQANVGRSFARVTPEEQQVLRARAWAFVRNQSGLPRREKKRQAEDLATRAIAELDAQREQQSHLVQPVQGGLVVPRQSLLITPDEARKIAARR